VSGVAYNLLYDTSEELSTSVTGRQFNISSGFSPLTDDTEFEARIKSNSASYTTSTYGSYITQSLALRRIRHPVQEFGGLI